MSKPKLLPCPLCGGNASVTRLDHRNHRATYNIACGVSEYGDDGCGLILYGGNNVHRKTMVEKWNTRWKEADND